MAEYKFLDDLAKFGNTTMTAMGGFQRQVSKWVSEQTTTLIKSMDLVTCDEMDARLKELEERLSGKPAAPKAVKPKTKKPE